VNFAPGTPAARNHRDLTDIRLGIDFDNTIVCYDGLFHAMALKQGLIPGDLAVNKTVVRDYLRKAGKEDAWTRMQGEAYGPNITQADGFPGVLDFFQRARDAGLSVTIVSHKTRNPYAGPAYDLHAGALAWLEKNGLAWCPVYLELTKQAKIDRIGELGCTHFIDDLPELFAEPSFPAKVRQILFDPAMQHTVGAMTKIQAWLEAWNVVVGPQGGGA
jgi:hypothetical protein